MFQPAVRAGREQAGREHVGRVLGGRYRIIAPLGAGASGNVFEAQDVLLRRRVAVKLLHSGLVGDQAFLRRFRAEAQAAALLNHPNIVGVYDWGEDAGSPFLVLEHLAGGSLRDLLDAGRLLTPEQAVATGGQAARALAYAHRRGVVHRDVKPANLLFDDEARLRIADFGVARALSEAAWTEPGGTLLGTARYSSPESAQGLPAGARADVYALALVLVEAVTGAVPFSCDTTIATLMARVGADLNVPEELGPLRHVVERAGRREPAERLDSAAMAEELDALARELAQPAPLPVVVREPSPDAANVDATDHGAGAGPVGPAPGGLDPPAVSPVTGEGPVSDALPTSELGTRGAAAPGTTGATATPGTPGDTAKPASHRRLLKLAVLAVVVLVLAGGGVAGARLLDVPSYKVPALHGLSLQRALAVLGRAPDHFRLARRSSRYDPTVPAGDVLAQSPAAGRLLRRGGSVTVVVSKGPAPRSVPDLGGLGRSAAAAALAHAGFQARFSSSYSETVASGQVISWSPSRGLQPKGARVTVVVSEGPRPRIVPNLAGDSFAQAQAALSALGLQAAQTQVYSDSVPPGQVAGSSPAAGATVQRGSTVTVQVSEGPHMVNVPNVVGDTVAQATAVLQQAGLAVGGVYGPSGGATVFYTNPQSGQKVHYGSSVDLYVMSGGGPGPH